MKQHGPMQITPIEQEKLLWNQGIIKMQTVTFCKLGQFASLSNQTPYFKDSAPAESFLFLV